MDRVQSGGGGHRGGGRCTCRPFDQERARQKYGEKKLAVDQVGDSGRIGRFMATHYLTRDKQKPPPNGGNKRK